MKYLCLLLILIGLIAYYLQVKPIIVEGGAFVPRYEQQNGN